MAEGYIPVLRVLWGGDGRGSMSDKPEPFYVDPDWVYGGNSSGTFSVFDGSTEQTFPRDAPDLESPGSVSPVGLTWHVDDPRLPVPSRQARRGIRHFEVSYGPNLEQTTARIVTKRGPFGWYARRYLARHPARFSYRELSHGGR